MKKLFRLLALILIFGAVSTAAITTWHATTITANAASGQWKKNNVGWWYLNSDGSYPINTWQLINEEWFHFDAHGYMSVGWVNSHGRWYVMNTDGRLLENCWVRSNGKIYFLAAHTGEMLTSTWIDKDYVGADGAWIPGTPTSCWRLNASGWWFRNPDGTYPANCVYFVEEVAYRFDARGYLLCDKWYPDVRSDGVCDWRYYKSNGMEACFEWIGNYFVDTSGVMLANTWVGSYYIGSNGLYTGQYCAHNWVKNTSAKVATRNYYSWPQSDWNNDYSGNFGRSCSKCNAYTKLSVGIDLA